MSKANKNNITKHQDVNRKLTSNEVDLNFQELINNIEDTQAIEINFNEQAEAIQQVRTDLAGGVTGTFTTTDSKTVTVTNGIITNIS